MRFPTVAMLIVALALTGTPISAEDSFEQVHVMPFGQPGPVVAVGDLAIYGITTGIMVVDISDPKSPVRLSRLAVPGYVNDVVKEGNQLYVAAGDAGVVVVDLTDSTQPSLIDVFDTQGFAEEIAVSGSWLFVADGDGGFISLNLVEEGADWNVVNLSFAREVAIDGDLAVVAGYSDVWVIDVSDPANMAVNATIPIGALDVAIDADRAYIAAGDDGLLVYLLADPADPIQMGTFTSGESARAVDHSEGLVYLSAYDYPDFGGLRVVDVANPWTLVEIGSIDLGGRFDDLHLAGSRAHLGSLWSYHSPVVDVSDPSLPVLSGAVPISWSAVNVVMAGDLALVGVGHDDPDAGLYHGIDVVDFSNPASPFDLATLAMPDRIVGFAIDGAMVVLVDEEERLHIYDISTPSAPVYLGGHDLPEPVWGVAISGEVVFLSGNSGLRVLDIGDATAPVQIGSMQPSSYLPTRLRMVGDHVYGNFWVSAWEGWGGGFLVIDVSDPSSPTEVRYDGGGYPAEFVLEGDRAYVLEVSGFSGTDFGNVRSYDISAVANPVALDYAMIAMGVSFSTTSLAAVGNRLLAGYRRDEFVVRTDRPWGAWYADLDIGTAESMATKGHYLFVAEYGSGIKVFYDQEVFVDDFEYGNTSAWVQ